MRTVFIGDEIHRGWIEPGLPEGYELIMLPESDPGLPDAMRMADLYLGWGPLTAEMVRLAKNLKLVQVLGSGTDWIDLVALRDAGVPVANTAGANAVAVGELVVGLILALNRYIPEAHTSVQEAEWRRMAFLQRGMFELTGKTIGLIGFGAAGRATARVLRGFDVDILYYDPVPCPPEIESELNAKRVELNVLLASSDIVSLHVPLSNYTRGLIDARALDKMKPDALLINISRGTVVDEAALAEALKAGRLRGAGLDVYEVEPVSADNSMIHAPNVVLTPHIGGITREALERFMGVARENFRRLEAGEPLLNVVPFPK